MSAGRISIARFYIGRYLLNLFIFRPLISRVEKNCVYFNIFDSIDIFFFKDINDLVYNLLLLR